jgi:hypothetical protein
MSQRRDMDGAPGVRHYADRQGLNTLRKKVGIVRKAKEIHPSGAKAR